MILNEECVELLGMLEKIEDRVAISRRINKLEDDGDHIFHAFADKLHQVEQDPDFQNDAKEQGIEVQSQPECTVDLSISAHIPVLKKSL